MADIAANTRFAGSHPQYPRSQRAVGVWARPGEPGQYAAGWAVRSGEQIDLWVVNETAVLPDAVWPAATLISGLRPEFVCVHPVEKVGVKSDGVTPYFDPVHYGMALALKTVAKMGMGVGYRRSEDARRSVLDLLIESGRVRFEGQAEPLAGLQRQHRVDPTDATRAVYRVLAALTSAAVTASYRPVVDEWDRAAVPLAV